MGISSLVIDISDDAPGRAALAAIGGDGRFTLGPARGTRHAIVVDTASTQADTEAFDWLRDLAGVRWTTVVRAYLDVEALPAGAAAHYL